jgi:hypothetical protein
MSDGSSNHGSQDVEIRLRGKAAERFRALHAQLTESDDLDHIKLGSMTLSGLGRYAVCEWLKQVEKGS